MDELPIFPLQMTLFPGGRIPLQVFEPRYLDMVKRCMKDCHGFVVVSIKAGEEVGDRPDIYNIGVSASIVDWNKLPNGLLGITVEGQQRVQISNIAEGKDKLLTASIEYLPDDTSIAIPEKYKHLVGILKSIKQNPVVQNLNLSIDYQDASAVSARLCELLPFDIEDKQALLELIDPVERLARLQGLLDVLGEDFNISMG